MIGTTALDCSIAGQVLQPSYTQHDIDPDTGQPRQRQSIAYSVDKGRSWISYSGNPVLTESFADFRDPKVFWHDETASWVMVLVAGNHVRIYRSLDLLTWSFASMFGAKEGSHDGVWECPDLFELSVEGDKSVKKWVLIVSIGDNAECPEGSRTQYFIGEFDGHSFTNLNPPELVLWVDHGRDNYAGVTWSDIPDEDGRRLFIGWMSNWKYANQTPTVNWRGAMTIPRVLTLRQAADGVRLVQHPVSELQQLRLEDAAWTIFGSHQSNLLRSRWRKIDWKLLWSSSLAPLMKSDQTERFRIVNKRLSAMMPRIKLYLLTVPRQVQSTSIRNLLAGTKRRWYQRTDVFDCISSLIAVH